MDIDVALVARLTLLLVAANGAPIVARDLLRDRLAAPVDLGLHMADGSPLLGRDKTWRGVGAAVAAGAVAAWLLGWPAAVGAAVGAASMAGDLATSFAKRRLGLAPGAAAPGLDQALESLAPLLLLGHALGAGGGEIAASVVAFIVVDLVVSPLLYRIGVRDRPR